VPLHRAAVLAGAALLALLAAGLVRAPAAAAAPLPWCGSGEPATDLPDAVSAFEWHVVYAIPSDGADRFGYWAPRITGDVAAMSDWWVGQDSTRKPRFDLLQAAGCSSDYARVDISVAHLPHANGAESAQQIQDDLVAAGFTSADKAYLVYYEGSIPDQNGYSICGQGGTADVSWAYSIVYVDACDQSTSDGFRAGVATHELVHGLGAVQSDAPHSCQDGHVCDSSSDLMKPVADDGDSLANLQLDVGRDDYYGHSGSWWDTQDSELLYRLDMILPPAPAVVATATSSGTHVDVSWVTSPRSDGLSFRIYDEKGQLDDDTTDTSFAASGPVGQTLSWIFRAYDAGGFLGPPATLRFKVGYGIVDATGTLLKDTVPPGAVRHLRAIRAGSNVLFRWDAVADPLGLRGYRISAAGLKPLLVQGTSAAAAFAAVRGRKVVVSAVDKAGNAGAAGTVRISR
jgi:hypothetical protein